MDTHRLGEDPQHTEIHDKVDRWPTVKEIGRRHGVGPRQVRKILEHMGLLERQGPDGQRFLTTEAIKQGLGRHITWGVEWPFDVISPLGETVIAGRWDTAVAGLAARERHDLVVLKIAAALEALEEQTGQSPTNREAVNWVMGHLAKALKPTRVQIALALGITPQLVGRYVTQWEKLHQTAAESAEDPADIEARDAEAMKAVQEDMVAIAALLDARAAGPASLKPRGTYLTTSDLVS